MRSSSARTMPGVSEVPQALSLASSVSHSFRSPRRPWSALIFTICATYWKSSVLLISWSRLRRRKYSATVRLALNASSLIVTSSLGNTAHVNAFRVYVYRLSFVAVHGLTSFWCSQSRGSDCLAEQDSIERRRCEYAIVKLDSRLVG